MILDYMNEKETPHFTMKDRLMILIHFLGITNQKQLQTITGWSLAQVRETLSSIRKQGKNEKDRNDWLEYWQAQAKGPYLYKLGQKAIEYVTALRDDTMGNGKKKKRPHQRGHWGHFVGFNDILCRLIENNIEFQEFLTGKEVLSNLYSEHRSWNIEKDGTMKVHNASLPFRPDGLVRIQDESYYLEYDTGAESPTRLTTKLVNYLTGCTNVGSIYPVIWVCRTHNRKKTIERCANELIAKFEGKRKKPIFPTMYCLAEGEETDFLTKKIDIKPFMPCGA